MPSSLKKPSIHRSLLFSILSFTIICVLVSIIAISFTFIKTSNQKLEKNTQAWADIIAIISIKDILNDDHDGLHAKLQRLAKFELINYVHIYNYSNDDKQLKFFTSYNKNKNYPAIPNKIEQLQELLQAKHHGDILELSAEISQNGTLYGYIYIQASRSDILEFTTRTLFTGGIVIAVIILASLFIVFRQQNIITTPINMLNQKILDIAKSKDFSQRSDPLAYTELDLLGKSLNHLLTRFEKQIKIHNNEEEKLRQKNSELDEKLSLRTSSLREANADLLSTLETLHQFQDQLVESEKMASLGDMVAGVAHEVNTPIGLGVTASTLLSDRLDEIKVAFEDKTLRSSQLKKFLNDGHENVDIIYRNLVRAADLISSFKKLAVDQSSEEDRVFNVKQLIDEVFLTLAPQLKHTQIELQVNCPDDLVIKSKPGPINQILINLILNSKLHGFEGKDEGCITITVMNISGQLNLNYHDNGVGVDESIKDKIFEPFTTTKRGSGGSGIGLHLVYNLITQALNGNIQLENPETGGVTFDINFPITLL